MVVWAIQTLICVLSPTGRHDLRFKLGIIASFTKAAAHTFLVDGVFAITANYGIVGRFIDAVKVFTAISAHLNDRSLNLTPSPSFPEVSY